MKNTSRIMELFGFTFLLAAALCFLLSCVSKTAPRPVVKPAPAEECKLAEVIVKTRRPNGTFDTPDTSPFGGARVVEKRWQFIDANGRHFFSETFKVKQPPETTQR